MGRDLTPVSKQNKAFTFLVSSSFLGFLGFVFWGLGFCCGFFVFLEVLGFVSWWLSFGRLTTFLGFFVLKASS